MTPIPENQQQALVSRLMRACGGAYSAATRRQHFISGPQWAAAYPGHALFHAPTRPEAIVRMRRAGTSIVLATHDRNLAAAVADRTIAVGSHSARELSAVAVA